MFVAEISDTICFASIAMPLAKHLDLFAAAVSPFSIAEYIVSEYTKCKLAIHAVEARNVK